MPDKSKSVDSAAKARTKRLDAIEHELKEMKARFDRLTAESAALRAEMESGKPKSEGGG